MLETATLVLLGGGTPRVLMSWTDSFGAGSDGFDSISRNFTNISEKDCNNRVYRDISARKFFCFYSINEDLASELYTVKE